MLQYTPSEIKLSKLRIIDTQPLPQSQTLVMMQRCIQRKP